MKKLYYKKWFADKNWGPYHQDMASCAVESETFYAGSTDKAVKFFTAIPSAYGSQVRIVTRFVPKSALVFCEDGDEAMFGDLNKKEMAAAALETVEEYLAESTACSFQDALKYANRQYDEVI